MVDRRLWPITVISAIAAFAPDSLQQWLNGHFGNHVTETIYNVSGSVIAAFTFYIFLDVNRRLRETQAVAPYITKLIRNLAGDIHAVCDEAAHTVGINLVPTWEFNAFDVERIFRCANPHSHCRMMQMGGKPLSLHDYIYYRFDRTELFLAEIMIVKDQLGTEGLMKVLDIKNCIYLFQLRSIRALVPHLTNRNLVYLSDAIIAYYNLLRDFEAWAWRNSLWMD